MSRITVNQIEDANKQNLPIFQAIAKRMEAVKQRAYDLFTGRGGQHGREMEDWLQAEQELFGCPAAELTEKNNAYELAVTLPGFQAKEIEVTTTPSELVIHAAARHEKTKKQDGVEWSEFGSDDVLRRFELPLRIQAEKVVASLDKGTLHIVAPLAARSASAAA